MSEISKLGIQLRYSDSDQRTILAGRVTRIILWNIHNKGSNNV